MEQRGEGLRRSVDLLSRRAHVLANGEGDDLAQEAFARALAAGVSLDALPWLRTVVSRLAIDRARRRREIPCGDASAVEELSSCTSAGPEDAVIADETRAAVRRALDRMPPRYREALLLSAEGGVPVSRRLGLSETAAWTLVSRARRRMREELRRGGFVPAGFLSRWGQALAPAAVAVAVIVAGGGGGSEDRAARPVEAPRVVAAALASAPADGVPPVAAPHRAARGSPVRDEVHAPPADDDDASADYGAKVCTPEETGSVPVTLAVGFEDREGRSRAELAFETLPADARDVFVEGC